VPLFDNERVLGVLYADTSDYSVHYGQEQLEVLTLLANMAAVKITNGRLLEAEQTRMRMSQELATATRIQQNLLDDPPASLPGWQCEVRLETCHEVGGDLYDFYLRPDGRLLFLIDVCDEPGELARRLNTVIKRSTEDGHFVTMFFGDLDLASGTLRYVNAGHNAPMLVGAGTVRELQADAIPIAILADFPYSTSTVTLDPGEVFALFTDGIPEAQRGEEFFGDDRLREVLVRLRAETSLESVASGLVAEVERFLGTSPRSDDVTLLLLRRNAAS
jgi:phosphoserine phosphatase RsbU/P